MSEVESPEVVEEEFIQEDDEIQTTTTTVQEETEAEEWVDQTEEVIEQGEEESEEVVGQENLGGEEQEFEKEELEEIDEPTEETQQQLDDPASVELDVDVDIQSDQKEPTKEEEEEAEASIETTTEIEQKNDQVQTPSKPSVPAKKSTNVPSKKSTNVPSKSVKNKLPPGGIPLFAPGQAPPPRKQPPPQTTPTNDAAPTTMDAPAAAQPNTEKKSPKKENLSGWLEKKGKGETLFGRKSWKARYFNLQDGVLSYYETEETTKPLNAITLHLSDSVDRYIESKPDPKRCHTFKLVTVKRKLIMNAESEQEMVNWINQLRLHIKSSSDYTLAERM